MKKVFLLKWGSYAEETIFCFGGASKKRILKELRKMGACKRFIREFKAGFVINKQVAGLFWEASKGNVIWIGSGDVTIPTIGTIAHEVHHAVHFRLDQHRSMENESEAQAYQFEFLLKAILEELK